MSSRKPPELVDWPLRDPSAPVPRHCPKCGRELIHYWWNDDPVYHEVACARWLQPFMRYAPGLLFVIRHWQVSIGVDDKPGQHQGRRYDHMTGQRYTR